MALMVEARGAGPRGATARSSMIVTDCVTVALGRFDPVMSRGLTQLIGEDVTVRISGNSLDDGALEALVVQHGPQVAILDEMSADGPPLVTRLRALDPDVGIVVLAHRLSRPYALQMLADGATACLRKDTPCADILTAIHLAAEGKHVLSCVTEDANTEGMIIAVTPLTPRECEVLSYLSRRLSNAEIASALQLGVETVRTHVANIRRKLGVRTRHELIGVQIVERSDRGCC